MTRRTTIYGPLTDYGAELPEREVVEAADYDALAARLEVARTALADIAMSSDMTIEVAKAKALRVYWGTADQPPDAHT